MSLHPIDRSEIPEETAKLVHDGGNPSAVYGNSLDPTLARDRQIPALHGENWL
jgi:hypothetical protein